jgi:hypothetical protein
METGGFIYYPRIKVQFTEAEVDALMDASKQHYDFECRRQCEPGGIIVGLRNRLVREGAWAEPRAEQYMTAHDLDLLAKVVQSDGPAKLFVELVGAFSRANDEYRRLNQEAA